MSGQPDKSAGISPRRALLEEVVQERSKAVAALPIDQQDPHPSSLLWNVGVARVSARAARPWGAWPERRQAALELCVVALAWLEAFDSHQPPG